MRSRTLLVVPCCFALLVLASAAAADEPSWPQWRGPQCDGRSADKGLKFNWSESAPKLLWTADGLGKGYSSVSIADGMIYTTGNTPQGQSVVAISDSGQVKWTQPIVGSSPKHGYAGARCTPSIDGDRLYVIGSHGAICCLSREDGGVLWQKDFKSEWDGDVMKNWGFSESPLVDGDWVLCSPGGPQAMMVALDKRTGDEVWRAAMPAGRSYGKGAEGAAYSSMVVSNGAGVKQYVNLTGRGAIGVRAKDGKVMWVYNKIANGTANIPTPIVDGDYVFCSTGYGTGAALLQLKSDGEGGVTAEEQYFLTRRELENHHGGMVLVDGHIYCGHGHNKGLPICVNMASGKTIWGGQTRGPGDRSAAATVADGHLVLRYQTGEVAAIEATPAEYQLKGFFKPDFQQGNSWAHPVIVGGRLYLREQDKLMCYDLR